MYKINLVNDDWTFIDVINVHAVPRIGEHVYIREQQHYYKVDMVTHDVIKKFFFWRKTVITVIISRITMTK